MSDNIHLYIDVLHLFKSKGYWVHTSWNPKRRTNINVVQ